MNPNLEEIIRKYYYDPRYGLSSAKKLHEKLKTILNANPSDNNNNNAAVTIPSVRQIQHFIEQQEVAQLTKQVRHKRKSGTNTSIVALFPNDIWQIDLMIYSRFKYKRFQYIFNVIDVYSRFASAIPLANRKMTTIAAAMEQIINRMGGAPRNITSDNEFDAEDFRKLLEEFRIKLWLTQPDESNKKAIVERFNRTLANLLQKWRLTAKTMQGERSGYNWPAILPDIIHNYNQTYHQAIKNTPESVYLGINTNQQRIVPFQSSIAQGSFVRIELPRTIFTKGDQLQYSNEIYKVINRVGNKYQLIDINTNLELNRLYPPHELQILPDSSPQVPPTESKAAVLEAPAPAVVEHLQEQKQRRIKRALNAEGISHAALNVVAGQRERKPTYIMQDEYGHAIHE